MIDRLFGKLSLSAGIIGALLVLVFPATALIIQVAINWDAEPERLWPSPRQWGLFLKTIALASAASLSAVILSLPGAYAIGRIGRVANAPLLVGLVVLPLMLPPMIYAFGWERLLGAHWSRHWSPLMRCVWIWTSWAWPIPALILGAGWSRLGRDAFEAALLVTSAPSAFMRVVLPLLSRHAFIALLILFVIFLGEYSVPHAQGIFVIASDLLDTVSYSERSAAVLAVARGTLPSLAVIVVLAWLLKRWRRGALSDVEHGGRIESSRPPFLLTALVLAVVGVTALLPLAVIAWRGTLISDLAEALRTYSPELFATLYICLAVGLVTALVGLSIANARRVRGLAVTLAIACGVVPGAAVGQAVLSAYQPATSVHSLPPFADLSGWIYDHWPIVVIGLSARFAWLGALVGWLARASIPLSLLEQARVDGLSGRSGEINLQIGYQWPALLSGAFLAAAMSMAELSVVSIVRVPYPNMVAMILIEKFHRFETGMLSALSLLLVASVLPGAILMFVALRRRDRSCEL